jgi:hypothetical protein
MEDNSENNRRESADIIPLAIRRLEKLRMAPPPRQLFDEPLGCSGTRRLFALYWLRAVRAPILHEGFLETVGDPEPYRIWRYHPRVIPHLAGFNLGDTVEIANHWLLVDCLLRLLYVGKSSDVQALLDYQKRGIIGPLPGSAPGRNIGAPMQLMGKKMRGSQRKLGKLLVPNVSVLHALESWIDQNVVAT